MATTIRHKRTNGTTIGTLKTGEIGVAANKIYFGPVPTGGDTSSDVTPLEIITSTRLTSRLSSYATTTALSLKLDKTTASSTYATKEELSNVNEGRLFILNSSYDLAATDSILFPAHTYFDKEMEFVIRTHSTDFVDTVAEVHISNFIGRYNSSVYTTPRTLTLANITYSDMKVVGIHMTPFVSNKLSATGAERFSINSRIGNTVIIGVCGNIRFICSESTPSSQEVTVDQYMRSAF